MLYGEYHVRYTEGDHRIDVLCHSLNEAEDVWELVDDPTCVVLDKYGAFVEYEDLLRAV